MERATVVYPGRFTLGTSGVRPLFSAPSISVAVG